MRNKSDLVGQKFGMLTVTADSGKRKGTSVLWLCRCDCGGEITAARHQLVSGLVQNCGCVPPPKKAWVNDMTGRRFGKLTVVEDSGKRDGSGSILWRCRCDCGGEILAVRSQLESGNIESCGCVPKKRASTNQIEDLTGRRFGELTVLSQTERDARNHVRWLCRCSCGKEIKVLASRLKNGHTRSCGCKRHSASYNKKDLTGQRFGRLTVLYQSSKRTKSGRPYWHCKCDCGNELDVFVGSLLCGLTKSCGCWNQEQSAKMHDHMHYQNDTCVEILERSCKDSNKNKAGFRGLFLTKSGTYRVMITFQKTIYNLGYYKTFAEAVRVRLEAEETLHKGYVNAFRKYQEKADSDPEWAENNPFYYQAERINGKFFIHTNSA